jgi:PGF-pre-PGF domain-containing protein
MSTPILRGGGGGGPPPEIEVMAAIGRVEITIPSLAPFETKTVEIPEARNVEISNISINVNKRVSKVKITITTLSSRADDVSDPSGEVYHYNVVDLENIEDSDINNVSLGFKVRKTWLENKNVNSDTISMNRYYNGSWNELLTTETRADEEYAHYSAISPGF